MWEPNDEQRRRMSRVLEIMRPFLGEDRKALYCALYAGEIVDNRLPANFHYHDSFQSMLSRFSHLSLTLKSAMSNGELTEGFADLLAFPGMILPLLHRQSISFVHSSTMIHRLESESWSAVACSVMGYVDQQYDIVRIFAESWLKEHPEEVYPVDLFIRQFRYLEEHTPEFINYPPVGYIDEVVKACVDNLTIMLPNTRIMDLIERLLLKDFNFFSSAIDAEKDYSECRTYLQRRIPSYKRRLILTMLEQDYLPYSLYREAALREPDLIHHQAFAEFDVHFFSGWSWHSLGEANLSDIQQRLVKHTRTLLRECAEYFEAQYAPMICQCSHFRGVDYLLFACKAAEKLKVKRFSLKGDSGVEAALARMAHIRDFLPGDDLESAVATLRTFKRETLEKVLTVSGVGIDLVLRAMDGEHLRPLLEFVFRFAHFTLEGNNYECDLRNSPDPADGVLDLVGLRDAMRLAGERDAAMLLKYLKLNNLDISSALMLIEAALGSGRAEVLKRIEKRYQMAVKAYGLLPLENDEELLERYLFFKRFAKEASHYGPQRQGTERAAAGAGLANLAQVAGYTDATRLEWAMEARLSEQAIRPGAEVGVGEYALRLELVDGEPVICCRRGDRALKSPPAEVKKHAEYQALAETLAQLCDQRKRFRATLESMMVGEQAMSRDELDNLTRLPMARPLLPGIIFQLDDGPFGIFNPEQGGFSGLDSQPLPAPAQVRVAHVWHLFQSGQLEAWQREVIRRRLVQPFKQAFRELYVLTPAEMETRVFSNRFRGHTLDPRVAVKLFQSRGWRLSDGAGEGTSPAKTFPHVKLQAWFVIPDAGHFLSETDIITTDTISFCPYPHQPRNGADAPDSHLPLADVPAVLFSEVMRDADLVVSVAQQSDGQSSNETMQRRGELVQALLADLALPNVRIEGHFAYVQGTRASYRVHLGSGAIHFDPGSYLCIVPERQAKRPDRLFLPFADAEDQKFVEVISKILLLQNDKSITDSTILAQIRARR